MNVDFDYSIADRIVSNVSDLKKSILDLGDHAAYRYYAYMIDLYTKLTGIASEVASLFKLGKGYDDIVSTAKKLDHEACYILDFVSVWYRYGIFGAYFVPEKYELNTIKNIPVYSDDEVDKVNSDFVRNSRYILSMYTDEDGDSLNNLTDEEKEFVKLKNFLIDGFHKGLKNIEGLLSEASSLEICKSGDAAYSVALRLNKKHGKLIFPTNHAW